MVCIRLFLRNQRLNIVAQLILAVVVVATVSGCANTMTTAAATSCSWETPSPDADQHYCWGILGNSGEYGQVQRDAGVNAKLFSLNWRSYMIDADTPDQAYIDRKRAELAALRTAGFHVLLSFGIQDTPTWFHDAFPDSTYVNQYGMRYDGGRDGGDANLIFNPAARATAAAYIQRVFADFGTDFSAVRIGGGRYGELTYPPAVYQQAPNSYWAFDRNAQAASPVPGWKPGDPSPNGEAAQFAAWYLDTLVEYQNWQLALVRQQYQGYIMILYPSWGMRPGDLDAAVAGDLAGQTAAERNGEVSRGFDFARQIAAITDPRVIVTTTWLDADDAGDAGTDARRWSPVKYLASLVERHPHDLALYGENTGHGDTAAMRRTVAQMLRYRLRGVAWFNEEELMSGSYATLADYGFIINEVESAAKASSAIR